MVAFGKRFYVKVIDFLTGYDHTSRVMQNGILVYLPAGNRAHELPDQVLIWLGELYKMIDCPNEYFIEEFEEFGPILHETDADPFPQIKTVGIQTALVSFSKWMECWIHLPLYVCRLGGNYGPEFARVVA